MSKSTLLIAAALSVSLLSACGGSGSDAVLTEPAAQAQDTVPTSATASILAYSSYAGSLSANEATEPLDVDMVQAPTSEIEEPIEVN